VGVALTLPSRSFFDPAQELRFKTYPTYCASGGESYRIFSGTSHDPGEAKMALFASEDWAELLAQEINSDKEMKKAGKGFDATIQFSIQNAGDRGNLPFWTHMKDGEILGVNVGESKCDFNIAGDYSVWQEIVEGKLDPIQAIMVKKLTFEGNMQTIMRYIKAVNQMMVDVKNVPTEF